jgi:hypothetical protein
LEEAKELLRALNIVLTKLTVTEGDEQLPLFRQTGDLMGQLAVALGMDPQVLRRESQQSVGPHPHRQEPS